MTELAHRRSNGLDVSLLRSRRRHRATAFPDYRNAESSAPHDSRSHPFGHGYPIDFRIPRVG